MVHAGRAAAFKYAGQLWAMSAVMRLIASIIRIKIFVIKSPSLTECQFIGAEGVKV
jgi:hypothetical protein